MLLLLLLLFLFFFWRCCRLFVAVASNNSLIPLINSIMISCAILSLVSSRLFPIAAGP